MALPRVDGVSLKTVFSTTFAFSTTFDAKVEKYDEVNLLTNDRNMVRSFKREMPASLSDASEVVMFQLHQITLFNRIQIHYLLAV